MERLFERVEACQMGLRQWSHDIHNNPRRRIDQLKECLAALARGEQTEETQKKGEELRAELENVYSDEDIFWRQRSKIAWAREGDRNMAYFHAAASARKIKNKIRGLFNSAWVRCEEEREIEKAITDYFGDLFQSSNPNTAIIDEVLEAVEVRVTPEMNDQISAPFTSDEVISALNHMAPFMSLGPDGLPVIFFHKYWHMLGASIITCVLDFLNLHRLPNALNYNFVVLIPKNDNPKRITEF